MDTLPLDDAPWRRLSWLTPVATLLTLASLMGFMRLIEQGSDRSPARGFVQVEVLEQAPPRPTALPPPARPRPQPQPQPVKPKPQAPPPPVAPAIPRPVVETPPAPPAPVEAERRGEQAPSLPATVVSPATPAPQGASAGASSPAPSRSSGPTTASIPPGGMPGGMPGGGQMGARAIYQPLPELPDSLRRRNFDVVAIARFRVASNGTTQVDLVQPTADPELNRLLVETLKRWRFFPALDGGKPVASTLDVRIPISVH